MSHADAHEERRIEALIERLEPLDEPRLAAAKELVAAVLELHGRGMVALMELIAVHSETSVGRAIAEGCLRDRDITGLLVLHGLHPQSSEVRVRQALAALHAELGVQGIAVELVEVEAEVARLRLTATGAHGFSVHEVRRQIEAAVLEWTPEIAGIELEGLPPSGQVAFVPMTALRSDPRKVVGDEAR